MRRRGEETRGDRGDTTTPPPRGTRACFAGPFTSCYVILVERATPWKAQSSMLKEVFFNNVERGLW